MTLDLMIDIETFGETPNAPIVQIGACMWDMDEPINFARLQENDKTFFANVDLQSSLNLGRKVDGSTIYWWMEQSEEARQSLLHERRSLREAFMYFVSWMQRKDPDISFMTPFAGRVWAWPTSFDLVIMHSSHRDLYPQTRLPWRRRMETDARTYCTAAGIRGVDDPAPKRSDGIAHSALDDALAQAAEVQRAYWKLKEIKG